MKLHIDAIRSVLRELLAGRPAVHTRAKAAGRVENTERRRLSWLAVTLRRKTAHASIGRSADPGHPVQGQCRPAAGPPSARFAGQAGARVSVGQPPTAPVSERKAINGLHGQLGPRLPESPETGPRAELCRSRCRWPPTAPPSPRAPIERSGGPSTRRANSPATAKSCGAAGRRTCCVGHPRAARGGGARAGLGRVDIPADDFVALVLRVGLWTRATPRCT